ncbi:DUF2935 domain-containing protein [Halobacillus salinarum]|uniref:DUF2935 domain-containing protein n=1 Tax=Halobacillus salinarum TaxID=2932257 RepID=A0ABY4EK06_9BACI|nr:DUF2935 domain-containing protein [Halobacillus salinarum]UOQ44509.1 DUF2935 domain-containing protein [Halobacillus salinarum]
MKNYEATAAFEHLFWLQILGDHARFIHDALYPEETEALRISKDYIETWDSYLQVARNKDVTDFQAFTSEVDPVARTFHKYTLVLLEKSLFGEISIHLSPTFLNHMVNELEEYLLVLSYLKKGDIPPLFHELHHHMLWLMDAVGHAGAINDELDGVEKRLLKKSRMFEEQFTQFYLKAVELNGYLRTNQQSFPALRRFNKEVKVEMKIFKTFLRELEEMELTAEILGTFSVLMADHMAREECYYLYKLAETTQGEYPACDPTSPRIER